MTHHFVYILQCGDNTYYTGYTQHLFRRYIAHCNGKGAKYTRGRGPLELVYVEEFKTKSKAMKREYQIKQMKKDRKTKLIRTLS